MKLVQFSEAKKIELFDLIASEFYEGNFGQLSKQDMELLMFHIYLQALIDKNKNSDGTIDYNKCSDYKISKDLRITQQKVRNLKIRSQLKYPINYDWMKSLATITKNARYDKQTKKVTLSIPDPNLFLEIQNFIEDNGAFVEKQLNSKVLQLRIEYYIDLILALESDNNREKIIKEPRKAITENGKEDSVFDESNIGKTLIDSAVSITTIAANISGLVSPNNVIGQSLIALLKRTITTPCD